MELLKNYDCQILYHPRKANIVADALSRKSMGSLAHRADQKREAIKELCRLFNQGHSLEVSETQPMIVHFWVRSDMIEEIKVVQDLDLVLVKLKEKA